MIELSEVQLKICTLREMHMHFQYIKCWLDKGFKNFCYKEKIYIPVNHSTSSERDNHVPRLNVFKR